MRGIRAIASAALAVTGIGLLSQSAQATLSGESGLPGLSLVRVKIDVPTYPNAKTADSGALADSKAPRVFDLQVTQGDGEHFTFASLQAALTKGTFYSPATGNKDYAQPGLFAAANNLVYDTYVTTPENAANILIPGQSDYVPGGGGSTGLGIMPGDYVRDHAIEFVSDTGSPTNINVTFGAFQPWSAASAAAPTGSTYTIARLTILGKSAGTINAGHYSGSGHTGDLSYSSIAIPLNGDMNGDGFTNGNDITAFISCLSSVATYHANFPLAFANEKWIADFNNDGFVNGNDISGFIGILSLPSDLPSDQAAALSTLMSLVPEPTAFAALGLLYPLVARRRAVR